MFSVKEYNKRLQVGDLIWYQKDSPEAHGGEDIGYIKNIASDRYEIFWFKPSDGCSNETRETRQSIKEMYASYIIPVSKK
jgi:hypothetical protein